MDEIVIGRERPVAIAKICNDAKRGDDDTPAAFAASIFRAALFAVKTLTRTTIASAPESPAALGRYIFA